MRITDTPCSVSAALRRHHQQIDALLERDQQVRRDVMRLIERRAFTEAPETMAVAEEQAERIAEDLPASDLLLLALTQTDAGALQWALRLRDRLLKNIETALTDTLTERADLDAHDLH